MEQSMGEHMEAGEPLPVMERQRVAPAKLAHIVFRTERPAELVAWYCEVLEARISLANDMVSFLTYDDEHHRIAVARLPGLTERPPMSIGVDHIAFTYGSPDDLFHTYDRLKTKGIVPYWTVNHGPTLSFYYQDPDKNQVELQIDLQEDAETANEWFAASDFGVNPIGVRVDAEDLIRRYRSGENHEILFARPVIAPEAIPAQLPEILSAPLSMANDR